MHALTHACDVFICEVRVWSPFLPFSPDGCGAQIGEGGKPMPFRANPRGKHTQVGRYSWSHQQPLQLAALTAPPPPRWSWPNFLTDTPPLTQPLGSQHAGPGAAGLW